ncbi:MAG: hypothetical protein ABL308_05870 [Oceanicaulis sp.]
MQNGHTATGTAGSSRSVGAGTAPAVGAYSDRLAAMELAAIRAGYLSEARTLADLRAKLLLFLKFERDHLDPEQIEAVEAMRADVERIASAAGE